MKKSRFTDSQIMAALKRVEVGLPVPEIWPELVQRPMSPPFKLEVLFGRSGSTHGQT